MEEAGDGIGVGDDLEDTHAAAALAAQGDVDGEDPGEEIGPTGEYPLGVKISNNQMEALRLSRDDFHGEWNYTVSPLDTA